MDDSGISVPTYSNKISSATIDHIFVNEPLISRVSSFCVVQDALDASDHRPLSCTLIGELVSLDSEIIYKNNKQVSLVK